MEEKVAKGLALNYGVYPVVVKRHSKLEDIIKQAKEEAIKFTHLKEGDHIILSGGFPRNIGLKTTNFMKIETIEKDDLA